MAILDVLAHHFCELKYSARVVNLHLGVGFYFFSYSSQSVSSVGGEVLGDTYISEEIGFQANNILWGFITVKFAKQTCSSCSD